MELSFSIFVNSSLSEEALLELVSAKFDNAERDRGYVKIGGNVLKISDNISYDESRCDDKDSGWEYYKFECEVFPVSHSNSVLTQRELANSLVRLFKIVGSQTCLLSEFESEENGDTKENDE